MLILDYLGAIAAGSASPSSAGDLPEEEPLPPANATHNVANASELNAAVSAAAPGDHIVLANGSYGGVTFDHDFPAGPYAVTGTPLVIRTANADGRPDASPNPSNSAVFSSIDVNGDGHILSGIAVVGAGITGGQAVKIRGSNNRLTRSIVRNSRFLLNLGNDTVAADPCEDVLVDHCTLEVFGSNAVVFGKAEALRRPILARIWSRDGQGSPPSQGGILISGWSMNNENQYREQPVGAIVRLCFFGPDLDDCHDQAWLHNKVSDTVLACCHFDRAGMVNDKFNHRFGIRPRYIANYAPQLRLSWYDDLGWFFGNNLVRASVFAGRSAAYDHFANAILTVGGFHACTRSRLAGNDCTLDFGEHSDFWCTISSQPGLPDPQPAGGVKPARTVESVTYEAHDPGHPDTGLMIRDHTGAINEAAPDCIDWVVNLDSQPGTAAPAAWLSELLAEHPWIGDLVPDPTSATGGPGGSAPWSVAQALTRGDAPTPNTGPFRDSPGGLL